jgi:stage II sporulation protein D
MKHWFSALALLCLALLVLPGCAGVKRPVTAPAELPRVRVGLQVSAKTITVSATGRFQISIKGSSRKPKLCMAGERWTFLPGRGSDGERGIEVIDPDGLSRGTLDVTLVVVSRESGSFLTIGGKRYRGSFEIFRSRSGLLTLVNVVDVESYLRGVVPNEIGGLTPQILEAVKAQAVAARTYVFYFHGRYKEDGFDVLPTVQDQVYSGVGGEKPVSDRAIAETRGTILLYKGKPVRTNYSSTCGGKTAAIEEVWPERPVPYLKSVADKRPYRKGAFCGNSPTFRWKETWTGAEFESIFKTYFPRQHPDGRRPSDNEKLVNVKIARRTKSGRVAVLEVITTDHVYRLSGDAIRFVVRRPNPKRPILRSILFDVDVQRKRGYAKTVIFVGGGYGHGVGMCQTGAIGMARQGMKAREILTHYYRGVKLSRAY